MTDSRLMAGKRGLIMGVANDRSLAWGVAKSLSDHGAELAFSYQGEALLRRLEPLVNTLGSDCLVSCDVTNDDDIARLFCILHDKWGTIDFVVHAIAFADKTELTGRYSNTSRHNFQMTMDISCFSFTAVCQKALSIMSDGGSLVTLSYYGAEKVMPHYNVMGVAKAALESSVRYLAADLGRDNIRVNGISAGPVRTLASSAIGDFRHILKWNEYNAPLRRNITLEDVGGSATYLLSSLSSGVTGEILHVDNGYHVVGMKDPEAPDIAVV